MRHRCRPRNSKRFISTTCDERRNELRRVVLVVIRTGSLLRKELLEAIRDRRLSILLLFALALAIVSSLDGWQRTADAIQFRAHASDVDRDVWLGQSETNPHDAAHFGRYAFRSVVPLSAFDSGITPYSGSAVWMEAHFQNPASLRPAEEIVFSSPLAELTAAWVIQMLGSLALLTMLFSSVCREKESGTLRNLVASNVTSGQIVLAKSLAAMIVVGVICVVLVALSLLPALIFLGAPPDLERILLLMLAYFIGLAGFGFVILAFSALIEDSKTALLASAGIWLLMCFVIPSIGSQFGEANDPTPRARDFAAAIETQAQQPFWTGGARFEAVAVYEAEVMTKHRAFSFASLGFNRDALVLQAHERFANPVYDQIYGDLYRRHQNQNRTLRYFSLLSPILALQRISSGIAGTDSFAQQTFLDAAESSRRKLVKEMNEDMLVNAGEKGFQYLAYLELWQKVDDFDYEEPDVLSVLLVYRFEWFVLLGWLIVGFLSAHIATKRLMRIGRI